MNTHLKYIQKNIRALSPVVASIILIAVTVAVSVAVAAWMGGMTISFMGTSSATITNVQFTDTVGDGTGEKIIVMELKNTGTKTITIAAVKVNNQLVAESSWSSVNGTSVNAGDGLELTISDTLGAWVNGNTYKIDLFDANNQVVGSTQQNAPGA